MSIQGKHAEESADSYTADDLAQFGSRLAEQRRSRSWTQRAASQRMRIHATRLSRIEHGFVWPGLGELIALREVYGIGLDALVFGYSEHDGAEDEVESLARLIREAAPSGDREALLRFLRAALAGYRMANQAPSRPPVRNPPA